MEFRIISSVVTLTLLNPPISGRVCKQRCKRSRGDCLRAISLRGFRGRLVIQRQGIQLRHLLQLIREKKVLVTINKKIASEDSLVQNGDVVRLVGHDGMGGTGLGPSL